MVAWVGFRRETDFARGTGLAQHMTDDEDDVRDRMAEQINDNLKKVYEGLVDDEVPDRFKSLIDQLRAKDEHR